MYLRFRLSRLHLRHRSSYIGGSNRQSHIDVESENNGMNGEKPRYDDSDWANCSQLESWMKEGRHSSPLCQHEGG
jgi:hypothetical protein